MEVGRQGIRRRLGLLALACLVLACSAAPVMADSAEPPLDGEGEVLQASEFPVANPAEAITDYATEAGEEKEREEELQEPAFVAERESSRHAYADLTAAEAEELLRSTFAETLAGLNAEPARVLSDAKLEENLGHGSAVITSEGRAAILEAGLPIEAENDEGELEKVDVSLEEGPEGFQPENPLVEVTIGDQVEEGIEVGGGDEEVEVTLTQAGAEGSTGALLGDKNVFFGEVEEGADTDMMVSPTSRGVEIFDLLRSVESPETLRFHLELPEGASLETVPNGGAQVRGGDGSILGAIPAPRAEDAQGTEVPVELEVEGDSLLLHTDHQQEDLAYPVLVDPEYVPQNWSIPGWWQGQNLQGLAYWNFYSNVSWSNKLEPYDPQWPGERGLFINTAPGDLTANGFGEYYINAPNTNVYIYNVDIDPFRRQDAECWPYAQPLDFNGYYDVGQNHWNGIYYNDAHDLHFAYHENWGHQYYFGLMTTLDFNSGCWRDLMAGGVAFRMADWGPPSLEAVGPGPNQWIASSKSFSVYARATDAGLGVRNISFTPGGHQLPIDRGPGCDGRYESRCPTAYEGYFSFTGAGFEEGERDVQVSALDALLKGSNTATFKLKVDQKPPDLQLHGQLMNAVNQAGEGEQQGQGGPELNQPVYNLKIDVTDGVFGTSDPTLRRSGVRSVEVLIDGELEETISNPSCPESSCEKHATYPVKLAGLSAGVHKLEVKAFDFAGNDPAVRQIEFEYMPATGISDDFVLQRFALPDGKNHEGESYQGPELAVNVMNGNVVYHQRDVDVEGPSADLQVELFYNSQLPKEESSEWGLGWTLSQTPRLEKTSSDRGLALTSEGKMTRVVVPQEEGQSQFSNSLNAVITKEAGGGYSIGGEGGTEGPTTVFNAAGQTTEVRTSPTASIDYSYSAGKLAEIAIDDPGSTTLPPAPVKKALSAAPTFVSNLGGAGSGAGELNRPAGVAMGPDGNIWVADREHDRIAVFSQAGAFVKAVGSSGTGPGQFEDPRGIAFNAAGDFWVADGQNSRLEKFSGAGEFLKAVGSVGGGDGQFKGTNAVAIDRRGHIWVADNGNQRLVELNEAGEFVKNVLPPGKILPAGVAVGPGGTMWVADINKSRIVALNEAGEFLREVKSASSSSEPGYFGKPAGIAVDSRGTVWVVAADRVVGFNQLGQLAEEFGLGQFKTSWHANPATDTKGRLWIPDYWNNRVQQWQAPKYAPTYSSSFGSLGSGNGQLNRPADVGVDLDGNLWVVDMQNNRLQKFNAKGELLLKLGVAGSGPSQFQLPKSIAFTPDGDFWVADADNHRLQQFTEAGQFIRAVGSRGSGAGQFDGPEGIAVDPRSGNLWVADTYNYRIVELNEAGEFIRVVNPPGLGAIEPTGIAVGPGGNVWVADWMHNRVVTLSPAGDLIRSFGTAGTGNGQFSHPDAIEIAANGLVLVGDQSNNRIQEFNQLGEYVTQFGAAGSGAGQFAFGYPFGMAVDRKGNLWVADAYNNRAQRWLTGASVPSEEETVPVDDDPAVAVQTTSGLVSKVSGAQAGQHTYGHEGDLLSSSQGPEGTTTYNYDPSGRMTEVTLPNGTIAEVRYDTTTGRAIEVSVDPAGEEPRKSTSFKYVQEVVGETESRETQVEPQGKKRTFYLIGADGGVLKWWNAEVPPTFRSESGKLVDRREKELEEGDQSLFIEGEAAEGIKKIQFIVNGNTVVDEKECTASRTACEREHLQWITNTEELPPGTMWIEAVLTDWIDQTASKRWWVNVPYIPPPPDGTPQLPRYKDVLAFREEFGLDLDLDPVANELELHQRVIETLGAWRNPQTPLGEVARAAWERWGVPLRPLDVAELEYREGYVRQNGPAIEAWGESHAPNAYGGYYVDNRAGGLLYVGFTENADGLLAQLKAEVPLAAADRLRAYIVPHAISRAGLESATNVISTTSSVSDDISEVNLNLRANLIEVGASNVPHVEEVLRGILGPNVPLTVYSAPGDGYFDGRYETKGKIQAGNEIQTSLERCTAGPGASKVVGTKPNGQDIREAFLLTAGHCVAVGQNVFRGQSEAAETQGQVFIGQGERTGLPRTGGYETDGSAVSLSNDKLVPNEIYRPYRAPLPVNPPAQIHLGQDLCFSGVKTNEIKCGLVLALIPWRPQRDLREPAGPLGVLISAEMGAPFVSQPGDSGGPVWDAGTKAIVGMVSGHRRNGRSTVAPLLPLPVKNAQNRAPGVLAAVGGDLTIETGG